MQQLDDLLSDALIRGVSSSSMSPTIPGSIVAIIDIRPGLVPRGRLLRGHLKLVFFDGVSLTPVPLEPLAPSSSMPSTCEKPASSTKLNFAG